MMFENRVLRRVLGSDRDEVTGEDDTAQGAASLFLPNTPDDQIKNIALCGLLARMGEWRGSYRVLSGGLRERTTLKT